MRLFALIISFGSLSVFAQKMEMAPLTGNVHLQSKSTKAIEKSGATTIDSTIIYQPDTISIPFLDDFSTNKFQTYPSGNYNLPGITFQDYYRLKDGITDVPFPAGTGFTEQETFHRYYNAATDTYSDTAFSTISVKVGDLSAYPVMYDILNLYPPYYIYDTLGIPDTPDTVWLTNPTYYQEMARQFFAPISDPSKLWVDSYAYHNCRYALNPRTLGVVTFDGLNQNGYPYHFGSAMTGVADYLTAKPLDLSMYSPSDSLYLSFLYQPEGLGDIPESTDSLVLEFYAKDLDEWFHVWSTNGDTVCPFKVAHIGVRDAKFFKRGFQFRFKNYGGLSGALDNFHIDYVHLRPLSTYDDTLFKDFAFVYPLNSLLKTYTSVPWDHYKNSTGNKMTDSLLVQVYNGSPNPENYQNGQLNFYQNSIQQGNFTLQGFTLAQNQINFAPETLHSSYHNLQTSGVQYNKSLTGNQQVFEVKANASAQFPNLAQNDSTTFLQEFYNYYSYDDGSAEAAFGPTGTQSRLAIKFNAYEADSIIGVSLCFVPSVNDVSNKLFLLTVWNEIDGKPGDVIYEDDAFFPRSPLYGNAHNVFFNYYFTDTMKVPVETNFYIGWRQLDANRMNLGLDRNIDNSSNIKFSVDGGNTWLISPFPGSAMVRPIFSTALDAVLGVPKTPEITTVNVYPNPTSGELTLDYEGKQPDDIVELFDFSGKIIRVQTNETIGLQELPTGMYFLRIPKILNRIYKVIKL